MKTLILVTGLFLAIRFQSHAATIPAASCAQADVQAAINAASAEDTVQVPAGTATHGAHLNLTRTAGGKPVVIHECWFTHGGDIGRGIQVMNNCGLVYRCSFDGGLEAGIPVLHHTGITLKWLGG